MPHRVLSSYYTVSGLSASNDSAEELCHGEGSRHAFEGTQKEIPSAQ